MPDTPVEATSHGPYDPGIEVRVTRLEDDVREMKGTLTQLLPLLTRIDATLSSTLPHIPTKAELADLRLELTSALSATRSELVGMIGELRASVAEMPSKAYLWAVLGVLVAAMVASYGAGLAAIALLR
jgi:lysylphosphatidylglycerol synthetase-like protein (DUF2156 family)